MRPYLSPTTGRAAPPAAENCYVSRLASFLLTGLVSMFSLFSPVCRSLAWHTMRFLAMIRAFE